MSINKAEKRTIWTALAALVCFALVLAFHSSLDRWVDRRVFTLMHAILDYLNISVAISVLLLGWMFFVRTLSRHRLQTAGLFAVIAMLELGHSLTYAGMPFHRVVDGVSYSMLYAGIAQAVGGTGLFLVFRSNDRPAAPGDRLRFLRYIAGAAAAAALIPLGGSLGWLHPDLVRALLLVCPILTLGGYTGAIASILYRHRTAKPQAQLTIIQGLIWLFFCNLQLLLVYSGTGMSLILGQSFKLAGYCLLLRGIYYVTVEQPLREQKKAEARARHMAYHDELTGLGNRRLLVERLTAEMNRADVSGRPLALMLLDVDRFKTINDSLGHSLGDELLKEVAGRLRRSVSRTDQVFRMGGDEFTIVVPELKSPAVAVLIAERVMQAFASPIRLNGTDHHITVSMGIALYPQDGDSVELLMRNADAAMYTAKTERNAYRTYAGDMSFTADRRLQLELDMRRALEQGQFRLEYQPLVRLDTEEVVGVEALVRWAHPERGLILPGEFIPVAEENGFIVVLGEWVLRTACMQNKAWQEQGLPPIVMSVNLSPRQFKQPDLPDRVRAILEETGLPPALLELEITESMTAEVVHARAVLKRLKALGIRISIDDFGTGYSSLLYLKTFPIDKLKIDRSFVTDLVTDSNDAAIVMTIATIARHMNLSVTAEGVENSDQLAFLKEQQCQEGQGYYFAAPIPADQFADWHRQSCAEG